LITVSGRKEERHPYRDTEDTPLIRATKRKKVGRAFPGAKAEGQTYLGTSFGKKEQKGRKKETKIYNCSGGKEKENTQIGQGPDKGKREVR